MPPKGKCSKCDRTIYFGSGSGQDVAFTCVNCGYAYCPRCSEVKGFFSAKGKCPRCGGETRQSKD